MAILESTVTSKGQLTLPKRVRDQLEIGAGTRLAIEVTRDGRIVMRKLSGRVGDIVGLLGRAKGRPRTVSEMNETIVGQAVARYRRSRRK